MPIPPFPPDFLALIAWALLGMVILLAAIAVIPQLFPQFSKQKEDDAMTELLEEIRKLRKEIEELRKELRE